MYENVSHQIACPYCGEIIDVLVDTSVEHQQYVEDCSVCCRPIALTVTVDADGVSVVARDENDA
ncbi:MAG: CPXCG motif-containing cysteine-rich protein [Pseudomonadales bacterium]